MPFNAQLASGTLSEVRFKHYITQDAHYLIGFGRALTLAAAKAPNPDRIVQFAKAAEGALVVERALHGSFFKQYGITPRAFAQTPLSPACHHYVSYLLATAYAEPYEVLLGALLPCFWIYAEVGRDIHARAPAANPYQAWIDTYAGEEFHAAVRAVIAATDESAADVSPSLRVRMHAAFKGLGSTQRLSPHVREWAGYGGQLCPSSSAPFQRRGGPSDCRNSGQNSICFS
jgi:thiaminase (transcriptional activator TenA)